MKGQEGKKDGAATIAEILMEKCQAADAALDADAFVALLTPNVVFRMGSQPELHGRDAVRDAVSGLFGMVQSIRHRTIHIWEDGHDVALRAEVNFVRKDGRELILPYVNTLTIADDSLISNYRIHIDVAPIFNT
jgi:ketosteroid isomerase-like protein